MPDSLRLARASRRRRPHPGPWTRAPRGRIAHRVAARDFSRISPSAKALLLVKSQTSLPYAREAAERLWGADAVQAAAREAATVRGAVQRRHHFEIRAQSVDRALRDANVRRVLELAAGLSFRGLALAAQDDVFYVDTDLPAMIATKQDLVRQLAPATLRGTLRVEPLDALDREAFLRAVGEIPPGPIAVVHEGLLMYLDD